MSNGSPGPEPPPKGKIDYNALDHELDNIINAVNAIYKLIKEAQKAE